MDMRIGGVLLISFFREYTRNDQAKLKATYWMNLDDVESEVILSDIFFKGCCRFHATSAQNHPWYKKGR